MNRVCSCLLALLAVATLAMPSASAAGLLMSIDDALETSSGVGSFEVILTNTGVPGGAGYDISAFSFKVSAPAGSSMMFTDASIATSAAPYLLEGIGRAVFDPSFKLAVEPGSLPAPDLIGGDAQFVGTGPLSADLFTPIAPG